MLRSIFKLFLFPESESLVKQVKELCLIQTIGTCATFVFWGLFFANAFANVFPKFKPIWDLFVYLCMVFSGLYMATAMVLVNSIWDRKDFWVDQPTPRDDLLGIPEKLKNYLRDSLLKWLEKKGKKHETDVPKHEEAKSRRGETMSTLLGSMAEKIHKSDASSPLNESLVKQIKKLCLLQIYGTQYTIVFWGVFNLKVLPECPVSFALLLATFVGPYITTTQHLARSILGHNVFGGVKLTISDWLPENLEKLKNYLASAWAQLHH